MIYDFLCTWAEGLYQVCVFRQIWKQDGRHGLWFAETRCTKFSETWQEAKSQCPLPSLCFLVDRKTKMAAMAPNWLRHFRLVFWYRWTEFNLQNLTGSKILTTSAKFVISGRSENQDGRPGLWLAGAFSTFSLKSLNGILRYWTWSKISTSWSISTKFDMCFSSRSENQDDHRGFWLAGIFSTSLTPLIGIQR